jgi:hypothetical protein
MLNVHQFIITGLWSSLDYYREDDAMLDDLYSVSDVSDGFKTTADKFLDDFWDKASHLFTEDEINQDKIEHDLWLTVEGHGAGFWDGDYQNGDAITEIVKGMGFHDSYWSEKLNECIERGEDQ